MRKLLFRLILTTTLLAVVLLAGRAVSEPAATYRRYMPVVWYSPPEFFDMAVYMTGDGRLYEVRHSSGAQARHQTQFEGIRFFHTKGNEIKAEWEELWATNDHIIRGTDTSPGNDQFYTLWENGQVGSAWAPRRWRVGDIFERNPVVAFYRKSDCGFVDGGYHKSWLLFKAYYPTYTFPGPEPIKLNSVIELAWLLKLDGQPEETYFYARNYGLVGWWSADRGFSAISEIHEPGARPDNAREYIPCMKDALQVYPFGRGVTVGPLPEGYRVRVK
jgi:hypothetical protein